jgi:hypothetical protein
MGWVFSENTQIISPAYGTQYLIAAGQGASSAVALDGAGNPDGAALTGGDANGQPVRDYTASSQFGASLYYGTTAFLLCGRPNYWLTDSSGRLLPVNSTTAWNVSKANEWGLSLVSSISPFAVLSSGVWTWANPAPVPPGFSPFTNVPGFPPPAANSPVCVWALYDTSISGSSSQPEISVAYDDGPASAPVKLSGAVSISASPLEVFSGLLGADIGTLFIWQGIPAEPLFKQEVRAAYWNNGLRRLADKDFRSPDWNSLSVTTLNPQPVALGGDAEDNVWAIPYNGFVRTSSFAHYTVTTSPGTPFLAVRYELGNSQQPPAEFSIGFTLDGQYLGYDQPWTNGTNYRGIPLPQDGKSHTVDLRNGAARSNGNYASPVDPSFGGGGYIDAIGVPPRNKLTVARTNPKTVALVLSHSVAVADEAGDDPVQGQGAQSSVAWPIQARAGRAFGTDNVVDESYGGELLATDCGTLENCTAYLASIKTAQPHVSLGFAARMLNDYHHGRTGKLQECLPQYEQALSNLLTAWSSKFPGVPLYVGSDIRESQEIEAGNDACTPAMQLTDWRSAIQTTVSEYISANHATWLHFVDMTDWVPQTDLVPDGVHPTVQGQIDICQAVAALFQQNANCGVPR